MLAAPFVFSCNTEQSERPQSSSRYLTSQGDETGAPEGSCVDADGLRCGAFSGTDCWCDQWCAEYGDCCRDVAEVCALDECADDGSGCPDGWSCQLGTSDTDPNNCIQALPPSVLECAGFLGLTCPDGLTCVDNPVDDCDPQNGGADCGGVCMAPTLLECGGFFGLTCPEGLTCVDDPIDDCDPQSGGSDCAGFCLNGPLIECGGFFGWSCPEESVCVDVPSDNCDPQNGGSDCGGICVAPVMIECAGFFGITCPETMSCVDAPGDGCDPRQGGSDCPGFCTTDNTK